LDFSPCQDGSKLTVNSFSKDSSGKTVPNSILLIRILSGPTEAETLKQDRKMLNENKLTANMAVNITNSLIFSFKDFLIVNSKVKMKNAKWHDASHNEADGSF